MSVYLLAVMWDRPNTRARCSRSARAGQRFVKHPAAADALDAGRGGATVHAAVAGARSG